MKKKLLVACTVLIFVFAILINTKPLPVEAKTVKEKEIVNKKSVNDTSPTPPQTERPTVWTQERLDEYFADHKEYDLVLQLPEGGWIGCYVDERPATPGKLDVSWYDENGNEVGYDIDTDPRAETVAEAKQRLLGTPIDYEGD